VIKLNGRDFLWEEGLSIQKIIDKKGFVFPRLVVQVNGKFIDPGDYDTTFVMDGDDVQILHIFGGG